MVARWLGGWLGMLMGGATLLVARPFTLAVYNVENLFDADGVAVYDDYQPAVYSPGHFATKLNNIAGLLARLEDGRGPDIILFQEIELDQTPGTAVDDLEAFWQRYAGRTTEQLLAQRTLPPELAGLPAYAWLWKALADQGLKGFHVARGDERPGLHEDGNARAITCVTFSRFPFSDVRRHPVQQARSILEVEVTIDGARARIFNVHWKSGAGDPEMEPIRVQNAEVLRRRLDAILGEDPHADVIIGGDFNSQHNQRQRYPQMKRTGINDVLRSQGNELAIRGRERDLYNLWYELPVEQRGSDTYRGEWGTLMQLIVSRGLYDQRGVQYRDNSFGVLRIPGLNADVAGAPRRWDGGGERGAGFSDHLPIFARFETVTANRADRWIALQRPSTAEGEGAVVRVSYAGVDPAAAAVSPEELPADAELRDGSWTGRLFRVEGEVVPDRNPRVRFRGAEYEIFGVDDATRQRLRDRAADGRHAFYGELGTFKGRWQFVVRDPSWVK